MKKSITFFIFFILFYLIQFQLGNMQTQNVTSWAHAQEKQHKLDIVLVLDNSGSMRKNDPKFLARDIVTKFLVDLRGKSRLGMVIFDRQALLAVELMETTSYETRAKILESLDSLDYSGQFSDCPAAIERAIYELKARGRKDAKKIIILLTDGIVDTGDKRQDYEKEGWLKEELTDESKNAGIRIIGIAFTDTADFSLIQTLALKTDGEYFRAYRAEDIQNIFIQINKVINKPTDQPIPLTSMAKEPAEATTPKIMVVTPAPSPDKLAQRSSPKVEEKAISEEKTQPSQKLDVSIPLVLVGIIILLGVLVIIMVFNRKPKTSMAGALEGEESYPSMPQAELVDIKNITGKKTLPLNKRINKIGRDPNNDIAILKDTVSSLHATIEYRDGFFYVEDQRSKNKTYLAGEEIVPHSQKRLKSGDEIMFNVHKFKFILPHLIPAGKTVIDFGATPKTSIRKERLIGIPDPSSQDIPTLPQAMLIDVKNITGKKTMRLEKKINKIGRGPGNDIEIEEDTISGFHASIEFKNGFFYLEDQRSKNKTCLGGEEIEPHSPKKLKSGDEIMFDVHKFIFLLEHQLPSGDTGDRTREL